MKRWAPLSNMPILNRGIQIILQGDTIYLSTKAMTIDLQIHDNPTSCSLVASAYSFWDRDQPPVLVNPAFRFRMITTQGSPFNICSAHWRFLMRSKLVFDAMAYVNNRYLLSQLVAKATRKLHKPGTRMQDTANDVLIRVSQSSPVRALVTERKSSIVAFAHLVSSTEPDESNDQAQTAA